jgi:hypothetical protein
VRRQRRSLSRYRCEPRISIVPYGTSEGLFELVLPPYFDPPMNWRAMRSILRTIYRPWRGLVRMHPTGLNTFTAPDAPNANGMCPINLTEVVEGYLQVRRILPPRILAQEMLCPHAPALFSLPH